MGGGLIDVKYISVYDVAAECAGFETPCFVKSMKDKYMAIWQDGGGNIDLLKEPYVLFHLMVASLLHDNYKDTLCKGSLISLKGQEFWKKWEREYLRGSLINKNTFAKAVKELHGRFIKRYEITLS